MSRIELAGAPVSWGVDFADHPGNPPFAAVLDGIADAGVGWIELGPVGYLPRDPGLVRDELARRGLGAVGTFVFDDFHRRGARDAVEAATEAACAAVAASGGRIVVLIDRPCAARAATAGRPDAARRLERSSWAHMVETFRRCAARVAAAGLEPVVHPHAGSYLELADEIEQLLTDVPASELGLCVDTGHALYAGVDPSALLRRHGDRVLHLHLKDVSPSVLDKGLGFWDAIKAGVFCPLGDGLLDPLALQRSLDVVGYDGFATVEQDRRPETPGTPEQDLRRSVQLLRACGIG